MSIKSFFYTVKSNTNETISFVKQLRIVRVVIAIFMLYIFFVSENSFIVRSQNKIKIMGLQKEINNYKKEIEQSKIKLLELNSNKENLEKFAREQYFMKKSNEDIYVIE